MSLRWSQRVLTTSMGGPVCRPYVLKRFPHGRRPQGSPLRRIQKLSLRFVGAGHWPARRGGAAIPGPTLIRLACARYLSLSPLSLRDIIPTPLDLRPFPPDRGNRPLDKESRPLLYGFQESLPGLGRGGPWASRRERTAPQKGTLIHPSVSTGAPSPLKGEGSAGAQCAPLR